MEFKLHNGKLITRPNLKEIQDYIDACKESEEAAYKKLFEYDKDKEIQILKKKINNLEKSSLFNMSDLELEREVCFKDVHYNKCGKNNPNLSSTFWYKLVGTGIGTAIIIKCPICGEEEDITDTSTW